MILSNELGLCSWFCSEVAEGGGEKKERADFEFGAWMKKRIRPLSLALHVLVSKKREETIISYCAFVIAFAFCLHHVWGIITYTLGPWCYF